MKKFIGSIKRTSVVPTRSKDNRNGSVDPPMLAPQGDHPEAVVVREVMAFCEAGAPGSNSAGDEYLHLPAIVDAAESSPPAAREAAQCLQRYLSKQNFTRGYAQYNSIMLLRILTDNPGPVFTQNFDKSFVSTFKTLLRECKDSSVQQIARETLDYIEAEKVNGNDTLMPLVEMWRKEKGGSARMYSTSGRTHSGAAPHVPRESRPSRGLPPPHELAARIEEARTSARLLVQMVQSTPQDELVGNELIKEFAERARQAHKSVQNYIASDDPSPDENTMLTLIETSEQLGIAMTKHQRAMLNARKASSANTTPQPQPNSQDPFSTTSMNNALPPAQPRAPAAAPRLPAIQRGEGDLYSSSQLPPPQSHQQQFQPTSQAQTQYQAPQQYPQYNAYRQHVEEEDDLYGNKGRVSPIERNEQSYQPPPGPPPSRTQPLRYEFNDQVPQSRNDASQYNIAPAAHSHTASRDYEVNENPFADNNTYTAPTQPPPQQSRYQPQTAPAMNAQPAQQDNSYSLFNRAAGQLRDPQSPTFKSERPAVAELDSSSYPVPPPQPNRYSQPRPGPGPQGYHEGFQPTPSFVQRQDSSTAHITMSGASPPPAARQ